MIKFLKASSVDATQGPLLPALILCAVPMILSAVVQNLFNAADVAVLGHLADSGAVAAVSATVSIAGLITSLLVGLSAGLKVILARLIGAKDEKRIKATVDTAMISALFIGVSMAVLGYFIAPWLLDITDCPEGCYVGALQYLRIYFAASPAIILYNYGSSILTAQGDTQRPLYYIMAGGALNVVLNIALCLILPQKVIAVAVATVAAQILGAVLTLRRLCKSEEVGQLRLSDMHFHFSALVSILRYGIPLLLANLLFPLANVQMQAAVNEYGVSAVAGCGAAVTIESIAGAFTNSVGIASAVFVGQNLGADLRDRVKKSLWLCLSVGSIGGGLIGFLINLFPAFFLSFFIANDPVAIEYGTVRLQFLLIYTLVGFCCVLYNTVQAYGATLYSAITTGVCVFGLRTAWIRFIYPHYKTFFNIVLCFMSSWFLMLPFLVIAYVVLHRRYLKGKLKRI